jgi:hypothetical protein
MGGMPMLLYLMATMLPPQIRQTKTSRAAADKGTWDWDLGLISYTIGGSTCMDDPVSGGGEWARG